MAVSLLWYGELCQLNVLAMHRQMASISSCCLFFDGGNLAVKNPCFFPCVRCIFHKYDMSIHKIQAPRAAFSADILSTKVAFPPLGLPRSPWQAHVCKVAAVTGAHISTHEHSAVGGAPHSNPAGYILQIPSIPSFISVLTLEHAFYSIVLGFSAELVPTAESWISNSHFICYLPSGVSNLFVLGHIHLHPRPPEACEQRVGHPCRIVLFPYTLPVIGIHSK